MPLQRDSLDEYLRIEVHVVHSFINFEWYADDWNNRQMSSFRFLVYVIFINVFLLDFSNKIKPLYICVL